MRSNVLWEKKGLSLFVIVLLLCGCTSGPKNAEEFRQTARSAPGFLKLVESFEVERPFQDVSATLRKKSDECLEFTYTWTVTRSDWGTQKGVNAYKPTFRANSKKAELHVQLKRSAVVEVGSPPDGFYRVVLDATPIAKNRTQIDIYAKSLDEGLLRKALHGWVRGDNLGCPDLTKR